MSYLIAFTKESVFACGIFGQVVLRRVNAVAKNRIQIIDAEIGISSEGKKNRYVVESDSANLAFVFICDHDRAGGDIGRIKKLKVSAVFHIGITVLHL